MAAILQIILPMFFTPKNYEDMLKRLAGFVLWEVYFISFFLRELPPIEAAFSLETYGQLGAAIAIIPHAKTLNIVGFLLAAGCALVTFVVQLHDRISDIIGVRRRFDRDHILLPLAKQVGLEITPELENKIVADRDKLMRQVFYKYASSRADKPLVDKHDIEHALNAWSWFWVLEEGSVIFLIMSFVAFCFDGTQLGWWLIVAAALMVVVASFQYRRLARYTRAEVDTISNDYNAKVSVQKCFDAL